MFRVLRILNNYLLSNYLLMNKNISLNKLTYGSSWVDKGYQSGEHISETFLKTDVTINNRVIICVEYPHIFLIFSY